MKQNNVVPFPLVPIDLDRVCLHRDEPCTILILPVMVLPVTAIDCGEPARTWVCRLLDSATKPPV